MVGRSIDRLHQWLSFLMKTLNKQHDMSCKLSRKLLTMTEYTRGRLFRAGDFWPCWRWICNVPQKKRNNYFYWICMPGNKNYWETWALIILSSVVGVLLLKIIFELCAWVYDPGGMVIMVYSKVEEMHQWLVYYTKNA